MVESVAREVETVASEVAVRAAAWEAAATVVAVKAVKVRAVAKARAAMAVAPVEVLEAGAAVRAAVARAGGAQARSHSCSSLPDRACMNAHPVEWCGCQARIGSCGGHRMRGQSGR